MSSPKIGIICSGGGMTCAYSAGALEAIYMHYGFTAPHVLIGASGSAGNCAYYAAGQPTVGKSVWVERLTDGQMINWRRWPVLNIDYLVNTVFRKQVPLDVGRIRTNHQTKLLIPTTNTSTGRIRYFSNHEADIDIFKVLIASKTLPLIAGPGYCVHDDCHYTFLDGDLGGQLEHHTNLATHYGCEKIIVIDNHGNHGFGMKLALWAYAALTNNAVRRIMRQGFADHHETIQNSKQITTLRPSQSLNMGALTDTKEKVNRAYDIGYNDAVNHPLLKEIFAHHNSHEQTS